MVTNCLLLGKTAKINEIETDMWFMVSPMSERPKVYINWNILLLSRCCQIQDKLLLSIIYFILKPQYPKTHPPSNRKSLVTSTQAPGRILNGSFGSVMIKLLSNTGMTWSFVYRQSICHSYQIFIWMYFTV